MDEHELLSGLSRWACQERAPTVDVSDRVLAEIRRPEPVLDWPLTVMTGIAATAAGVVFTLAADAWSAWQDPMTGLLTTMNMVLE